MPKEKYSYVDEIFEHSQRIGRHYDLYDRTMLPDARALGRLGRRPAALAHHDQSRRRHQGAVRHHGARHDDTGEAAGHPGHRDLRGPLLPHQPLGLRLHGRRHDRRDDRAWPTRGSRSSAPARRRSSACRALAAGRRASVRVPAHAVVGRLARQQAHRSRVVGVAGAGLAARAAGELQQRGRRPARGGGPRSTTGGRTSSERHQLAEGREPAQDQGGAQPGRRAHRHDEDGRAPPARRRGGRATGPPPRH